MSQGYKRYESLDDAFFSNIEPVDMFSCWNWKGSLFKKGYGRVTFNKKYYRASHIAYTLCIGEIPKGLYVCHHCDNPQCVNPNHLFIGTALDNMRDCLSKNRKKPSRGEAHGQAKLTEKQVLEIRSLQATLSQQELADLFNVSITNIRHIVQNKSWRYLCQ